MTEREAAIFRARALIQSSREFWRRDNGTRYFAFTLLEMAGNARRGLNKASTFYLNDQDKQMEMF